MCVAPQLSSADEGSVEISKIIQLSLAMPSCPFYRHYWVSMWGVWWVKVQLKTKHIAFSWTTCWWWVRRSRPHLSSVGELYVGLEAWPSLDSIRLHMPLHGNFSFCSLYMCEKSHLESAARRHKINMKWVLQEAFDSGLHEGLVLLCRRGSTRPSSEGDSK